MTCELMRRLFLRINHHSSALQTGLKEKVCEAVDAVNFSSSFSDLELKEEEHWGVRLASEGTMLLIPSNEEDEPKMEEDWWDDSRGAYAEVNNVDSSLCSLWLSKGE